MLEILERRIKQIYSSLNELFEEDSSKVVIDKIVTPEIFSLGTSFSTGKSEEELYNRIETLISNIACLKDHLKKWCISRNIEVEGELLINTNQSVAIVHDLWNSNKHFGQNEIESRSKKQPKIQNLKENMVISSGIESGGYSMIQLEPKTGRLITSCGNGGSVHIVINADITDGKNKIIGDLIQICKESIDAWEKLYKKCGIEIKEFA